MRAIELALLPTCCCYWLLIIGVRRCSVRRSTKHTNGAVKRDGDGLGSGGSARSVISRAREEVMVEKLSAPLKRADLNSIGPKSNGNWRAQQEMLKKEIKAWPDNQMNSLMPVQEYF